MTGQKQKLAKSISSSQQQQRMQQGMRLVGAYFGAYALVGFGYPMATGESVLESISKRMGWKPQDEECMDCQSYYDREKKD